MIDSWLQNVWNLLLNSHQRQKLPHALLLQGPAGIGKHKLSRQLARAMLCQQPRQDGSGCGQCQSCRLFNSGTHPDFLEIVPEEDGKSLKVDQIRQMAAELAMTSHAGGYKVALITPADSMNLNAANSLLKTLEEPTDNTLILLVTSMPSRLPVTIRSRCQACVCTPPEPEVARQWLGQQLDPEQDLEGLLELANGAPYAALALHETAALASWQDCLQQLAHLASGQQEPVSVAADWNKAGGRQKLGWLLRALQRRVVAIQTGQDTGQDSLGSSIPGDRHRLDDRKLFILMDNIGYAIDHWASGLNTQLLLEDILICWSAVFQRPAQVSG